MINFIIVYFMQICSLFFAMIISQASFIVINFMKNLDGIRKCMYIVCTTIVLTEDNKKQLYKKCLLAQHLQSNS